MASDCKVHTFDEVSNHNSSKDCWLIISGKVYDVTPFMEDQPGGDDVLLSATGKDATNDFEDVGHSDWAREMMDKYCIGEVDGSTVPSYVPPQQANNIHDKTPEFIIEILEFLDCNKDQEVSAPYEGPNWILPKHGYYKINTDARWKSGKAAAGGVVRGDSGSWVSGFSIKFNAKSAEEAEFIAIRYGLQFMKELHIEKFELEIDAKRIRDSLHDKEDFTYHLLSPLLHDIAHYLEENENLDITYVPRNINAVAHGLAEIGMVMKPIHMVHHSPPLSVLDDYEADLKAVSSS